MTSRRAAVVVEMGRLPVSQAPARGYIAAFGAARTGGWEAAEALGRARR
jgi:hypothetical protein